MKTFTVVVRLPHQVVRYQAVGADSATIHIAALDRFGACGVTVKPS